MKVQTKKPRTRRARKPRSSVAHNSIPPSRRRARLSTFPVGDQIAMKVVPLGESVVVRPLHESDETTSGGIVLPANHSQSGPAQGKVLSVGDGRLMPDGTRTPLQVQEGDRILYNSWAGTRIDVDGSELLVMNESDILGTLG